MKTKESLLNKYYSAETSLEEEKEIISIIIQEDNRTSEQDIFEYFEDKSSIPENLEENLFQASNRE